MASRESEQYLIYQADEEKKGRKLNLQIQHLELNYKIKLEALELARKVFVPQ